VAYQAWRLAVGDTDPEPVDGIPANQRLFFGWAQTWRTILRPQAQKERLATDPTRRRDPLQSDRPQYQRVP
jgi:putative endopeptidase